MAKYFSLILLLCTSSAAIGATDRMSTLDGRAHSLCQRKCQAEAKQFFRECRQNGGTEEECRVVARERFARCVENNCTPAATCEERCKIGAVHIFRTCVESGEEEQVCASRARAALFQCLTENCQVPDSCEKRCEYLGHQLARLCVAEGGSQEACAQRAREFVQNCVQDHCLPCGGILGVGCPKGEFCQFPPGECHVADNQGRCTPIPQACPLYYQPVCGCDGKTYGNDCEAAAAGVSIDHAGPCHDVCGGIAGVPCPEGQFCEFPIGECNVADNQGHCRPTPEGCPRIYDPVCGCDGKTYGNACEAAMAGVSIDHAGACAD